MKKLAIYSVLFSTAFLFVQPLVAQTSTTQTTQDFNADNYFAGTGPAPETPPDYSQAFNYVNNPFQSSFTVYPDRTDRVINFVQNLNSSYAFQLASSATGMSTFAWNTPNSTDTTTLGSALFNALNPSDLYRLSGSNSSAKLNSLAPYATAPAIWSAQTSTPPLSDSQLGSFVRGMPSSQLITLLTKASTPTSPTEINATYSIFNSVLTEAATGGITDPTLTKSYISQIQNAINASPGINFTPDQLSKLKANIPTTQASGSILPKTEGTATILPPKSNKTFKPLNN